LALSPSAGPDLSIEALRGLAAMMVVATHYAHFVVDSPGMLGLASTGVNLFFVLSGFVFAPYLHSTRWGVLPHLARRAFRMFPLYLLALAIYVLLKLPAPDATAHLGVHLLMLHTTQSPAIAFFYNPAFWSLPPELEFYLLLPLLARIVTRFGLHALLWPALALRFVLAWPDGSDATTFTIQEISTVHLPSLLVEFLLGAWAWRWLQRAATAVDGVTRVPRGLLAFCCALTLLCTGHLYSAVVLVPAQTPLQQWASGQVGVLAAAAYACAVVALAGWPALWRGRSRAAALAVWAGHLSYGVYLLHNAAPLLLARVWPTTQGVSALVACLVLTLAAAWAAHLAVERPMRELGRRLSWWLARRPPQGPARSW